MFRMIWPNIKNRPAGSLAVAGVVMLIAAVLFLGLQLIDFLHKDLERQQLRLGADLMLIPRQVNYSPQSTLVMTPFLHIYFQKEAAMEQVSRVKQEALWLPQFYVQDTVLAGQAATWHLVGTDWKQDFILRAWHPKYDLLDLMPKQVLVGDDWIGNPVSELSLFGEKYDVVDKLPATGTELDHTVFMSLADAWSLAGQSPQLANFWQVKEWGGYSSPGGLVSAVLVKTNNPADLGLLQQLTEQSGPVKWVIGSTVLETTKGHLVLLKNVFYVFGMMLWLISIVLLMISLTTRLLDRKQELGMLFALGARKKHLYQLLVLEVGVLAILGVGAGSLTGVFAWLMAGKIFFGQAGFVNWSGGWSLLLKLAAGGLAAQLVPMIAVIFPVYRLSRWEVAELLNLREK